MSKQRSFYLIVLIVLLAGLPAACRKQQEPTPSPTEQPAEPSPTAGAPTTADGAQGPVGPAMTYDWPPQLVYSSPLPGEEVTLNGAITLRFDQPMDQPSVESAFSIAQVGRPGQVKGSFSWPRDDTLIFVPQTNLAREQLYEVQVTDAAHGRNDLPLRQSVQLRLQTVGFLEVSQVLPADGSRQIETDAAITVLFNRPVVPLTASGQQSGLPQPLLFNPSVQGRGEWVSTSIYRFVPDPPLAGATDYQVTINDGLADITGGVLADDFTWRFTTLSPSVVSFSTDDRPQGVRPTELFTVTFNMPMDQISTEAAVILEPDAALSFDWSADNRQLFATPDPALDLGTEYRLTVAATARSAGGSATLDRETATVFATVAYPAVEQTIPDDSQTADRWQNGINIRFASPMDLATLEDQIDIRPAPDRINYFWDDFNYNLFLGFDLERNTEYVVTIPGSAADPYGNILGDDYTWRFFTEGFSPMVSLSLPGPTQIAQFSTSYPTEVDIVHRNVSQIDVELYDLGVPVAQMAQPYLYDFDPGGQPTRSWSIPVDLEQDAAGVYTLALANGDVLPVGVYFLSLNAPEVSADDRYWQNQKALLVVADTNLVVKEMIGTVHVWATDLATGQPAAGRNLTVFNHEGRQLAEGVTDSNGLATIDFRATENLLTGLLVTSQTSAEGGFGVAGSAWNAAVEPWRFGLNTAWDGEPERYAYLYTDRPIYRPGDTVHFRGIVRDTNYGRYPLPTDQEISLGLRSLNTYEDTPFTFDATLDADGEFSGEYAIPQDASLGNYEFFFTAGDIHNSRSFTVAEYRAPEFQVTATSADDALLRGESTEVVIEASYFFGGPATDLSVSYTIYEDDFRLPWEGRYYSFGDDGDYFYVPNEAFNFGSGGTYGRHLTGGEGRLDENGRLVIELPASLLEDSDPGSRTLTVEASVYDISNFPVTARASVVFHQAETYVGVVMDGYVGTAGTSTAVDLITVDWDGQPVSNTPAEVVFYRRQWEPVRDTQFNVYYTRWEAIDTEVDRTEVTTDNLGRAQAEFIPEAGGQYLAVATVTDSAGRSQTSSALLWVADSNYLGWASDPREKDMELAADKQEYQVGETAQILVPSPFGGQTQAWLTIERGAMIEERIVTLESTSDVLEIPITADFAPNVFVTVHAVKGIDSTNAYPDIRIGMVELVVSPERLGLNVSLTPQSTLFQPGDTVTYDILVTDYQGRPVQANFSLALVDLAVLSLKPDNAPHILEAFYARQPIRSQTGSGLIYSAEGLEVEIPLEQAGLGGGGGGEVEAAQTFDLEDEDDVRRDFPDTAHWEAKVATDEDGRATVDISLPDTLTTWRLSSKAVIDFDSSRETLVGQASTDIITTLPLLIRPVTPRFFTVGDQLLIGAIVHNNTGRAQEVTVSLAADGLTLEGDAEQEVAIPDGGRVLVQWPVQVDDVTFADLIFRASAGEFSDATKPSFGRLPDQLLPVVRYAGEDVVGTSGVLDEAGRVVEAILLPPAVDTRQGEVRVQLNPSLAGALTESLEAINNRRDNSVVCAHALADQLLPNVATAGAIARLDLDEATLAQELAELIASDISLIESLQRSDGGWGWCYSPETDPYLSAYVLLSLVKAQALDFTVSDEVLERGLRYLNGQIRAASRLTDPAEINRQAFFLYVLAEAGDADTTAQNELFEEHRALLDPYARALLALAYQMSSSSSANPQALLSDLNNRAIVSATGVHWEDAASDWFNLSTDIRGTAMVLDALARLQPDSFLAPGAVRWLMVARTAGHWSTGQEDAWSIMALSDWMIASGELEADYDYRLAVNGDRLASGRFNRSNILSGEQLSMPVGDLFMEEPNFLDIQRGEGPGQLYYTAHLDSHIFVSHLEPISRGFTVQRQYFDAACDPEADDCRPITEIEAGQQVRVQLTIIVPNDMVYAVVEDHIPAGSEAIDPGLSTSASGQGGSVSRVDEDYRYGYWGWWYFNRIEYRDDRVVFYSDFLPAGTYQYTYTLQTTIPGSYQVIPAMAWQAFFPEVFGRSDGLLLTINP
jgi:alpha-2-macroglobulin